MNVVVVDQFEICRSGFRNLLTENFEGCTVFEAENLSEGIDLTKNKNIRLFLVDIDNLKEDNIEELDWLRELSRGVPTIAVTLQKGRWLKRAFELNFSGYIEKQCNFDIVISALNLVLAGGKYFPPDLYSDYNPHADYSDTPQEGIIGNGWARNLTQRQLQVLNCLAEGKSNKIIARDLNISAGTVKTHISVILKDLKAKNRTQAVNIANHLDLL